MTNPTNETTFAPSSPPVVPPAQLAAPGPTPLFTPAAPRTLQETGLRTVDIEALILRFLLQVSHASGRSVSDQLCLPFGIVQEVLQSLKAQMLVGLRGNAPMGDYVYELSDEGLRRARRHMEQCTYYGAAPVSLADYCHSVEAQTLRKGHVKLEHVAKAFEDLTLEPVMICQLGQALASGRGLFLYGPPGNGKTTVAERLISATADTIWIPRTIATTGELIRVFDPSYHREVPTAQSESPLSRPDHDRRWVRIRRPCVVVGGELTMSHLELSTSAVTGVHEAPVQVKSNCGALVIDDFGRQRIGVHELLNRWIVPLERRHDSLTLGSGRQIRVPFEQLLVFATNLEPRDVSDEAFLRRIPYKVELEPPTEDQFRGVVRQLCERRRIAYQDGPVEHLLERHFRHKNRPLRFCHARDLLDQIQAFCEFQELPVELTDRNFDVAAFNYFAGL